MEIKFRALHTVDANTTTQTSTLCASNLWTGDSWAPHPSWTRAGISDVSMSRRSRIPGWPGRGGVAPSATAEGGSHHRYCALDQLGLWLHRRAGRTIPGARRSRIYGEDHIATSSRGLRHGHQDG